MVLDLVAAGIEAALQDLLLQQREVGAAHVDFLDEFGRIRERLFDRLRQWVEIRLADMDRAEQVDRAGVAGDPPGEQFVLGRACPAGSDEEDHRQQGGETPHARSEDAAVGRAGIARCRRRRKAPIRLV